MKMEALKFHTFDGKTYHAGDCYDAADEYVVTLTALQFAKPAEGKILKNIVKTLTKPPVMETDDAPTPPAKKK